MVFERKCETVGEIATQFRVWFDRQDWFPDKAQDALFVSVMEALNHSASDDPVIGRARRARDEVRGGGA